MVFMPPGAETAITKDFESMDMSAGGIRMETDADVEAGSFVALQIQLPDRREPVDLFAKVVWIRTTRDARQLVGLSFLSSSDESVAALRGFLEPRLK
jgi:Tfp pilus assembly protein PilZ